MNTPRKSKIRWIVAILVLVGGLALYDGVRRTPTPAAEGITLNGAATRPASGSKLRLGTFNIDSGKGMDGKRDLDRSAAYLRGCDLVALNEVAGGVFGSSSQAQVLGEKTGLAWLFAPVERRWWHESFGNGMLSSVPITHWQRLPIAGANAHSHRNVILANANWEGRTVNLLIAHVEREDRQSQLRAVLELYLSLAEPSILMGDLNSTEEDPQIREALAAPGVVDAVMQTAGTQARGHIDWILVRGLKVESGGMQPKGVSDHPFFWVEISRQ